MTPGQKLRRLRVILGKTQADFDAIVGARPGRTQSYEKIGAIVEPKKEFLQKIIDEFRATTPNLTVDWFFDGVDDLPPGLKPTAPSSGFFEYPVLQEIPGAGATFNAGSLISSSATSYPRGTFWAAIGDDDRSPAIRRGDYVLLVPEEALKTDTVFAIRRADHTVDLFNTIRVDGVVVPTTLFEGQSEAGQEYHVIGKAVELRRPVGGGLIAFQSPTGLSLTMVTNVL